MLTLFEVINVTR